MKKVIVALMAVVVLAAASTAVIANAPVKCKIGEEVKEVATAEECTAAGGTVVTE